MHIAIEAVHLVCALARATGHRPHQWRPIRDLPFDGEIPALQHAVDEGWMLIQDGQSVCLTDKGRQLATH